MVVNIVVQPYNGSVDPTMASQEISTDEATTQNIEPEPSTDGKPSEKKPTPRSYLERIPIAGLSSLLYANEKWEVFLWRGTLLLAVIMTVRYVVPAFTQYLEFDTALEIRHISDPHVPFPHVHVGIIDALNAADFGRWIEASIQQVYNDSRYRLLADRVVEWCADPTCRLRGLMWLATLYMVNPPMEKLDWLDQMVFALNEVISKTITAFGSAWPGFSNLYKDVVYECEDVLMRCTFNGIEFSCCSGGSHGLPAARAVYFKLNVNCAYFFIFQMALMVYAFQVTSAFHGQQPTLARSGRMQMVVETSFDETQNWVQNYTVGKILTARSPMNRFP